MTREEQRIEEAKNIFSDDQIHPISKVYAFIEGAKWADGHPQLSKEQVIDKACEWLRNNIDFYVETNYDEDFRVDIEQLLNDFRKAMEE